VDWEKLQAGLISTLIAVAIYALRRFLGVKDSEEARRAVTWAIEQGVAYAALKLRDAAGPQKKDAALTIAESLAPKAVGKLDDGQKSALVEATYARLKPSLPHPSMHATPGADIPIDVVHMSSLSERPTPFPPLRGPVGPGAKGTPPR
jgi:hypothetical protein